MSSKWGQHFLRFVSIHVPISCNFSSIHSRFFLFSYCSAFNMLLKILPLFCCFVYCCFTRHSCHMTFFTKPLSNFAHDAYFVKAPQINTICSTAYIHYKQWLLPIRYKTQLDESLLHGMGAGRMMQHSDDWPVPSSNFPILKPEIKDVFSITAIFDSKYFFHLTICYVLIS